MASADDNAARPKPRLVGLDLLRLAAIVLVLGRHMWPAPEHWTGAPRAAIEAWHRGGWVGVDLFFVLSGFLVSGLLFTEFRKWGRLSLGRFYTRRGWKIYPPFFVLIGATILVNRLSGQPMARRGIASEVLFLQSYIPGLWNHTWSLAVEEHFYIFLPLVLTAVLALNARSRTPLRPVLAIAAVVAAGCLVARVLTWRSRGYFDYWASMFATHLRIDSLFFGVAISYAFHFHQGWFHRRLGPWHRPLMGAGALLLLPPFFLEVETSPFLYTVGFTLLYLGSGMLLVGVLLARAPRSRLVLWLAAIGTYSYSIYLWHMPMIQWLIPLLERTLGAELGFGVRVGLYVAGSIALGVVMARLIEVPTLRLRDRWFPPRSDAIREG